tara:strand:+ start:3952 stop:5121 length:1170 start_codon:yes stop_codon:yes gene_type:complete
MKKIKICVVTGTRADYGLLFWLLKDLEQDEMFELDLVATGMHLSAEFGFTYKEIEKDFKISKKIEMSLASDSPKNITKAMGNAQILFADAYDEIKPDIVLVLGDRYEILSSVIAAMMARIPIAHLHGGESSEGLIDEPIRHSITKMSQLHFCATERYKSRIIQMGENPDRVFNVGGMGIENIKRLQLLSKTEFEQSTGVKIDKKNLLITFHPVTFEKNSSKKQFQEVLDAVTELNDTSLIFTKANSDIDGKVINQMIDEYAGRNSSNSYAFVSMGQLKYLSAMQFIDGIVGNSSSGLTEAPTFKIGTINIGDRQKGRIKAKSVIDCLPNKASIKNALKKLYSKDFQSNLSEVENPYGDGCASKYIIETLKTIKLENILKKEFFKILYGL